MTPTDDFINLVEKFTTNGPFFSLRPMSVFVITIGLHGLLYFRSYYLTIKNTLNNYNKRH